MAKYRKKPVVIEAMQWTGDVNEIKDIHEMNQRGMKRGIELVDGNLFIDTLEGKHKANVGDFIIKGVSGELYPCKPDIFEMTYEPVNSQK